MGYDKNCDMYLCVPVSGILGDESYSVLTLRDIFGF